MRTIAVFFTAPGAEDYPFDVVEYRKAYCDFAALIQQKGGRLIITRGQRTYLGGMRFSDGWVFHGERLRRLGGEVVADVIFNKGRLVASADAHVVNDPALEELCTVKTRTYERFAGFSPWYAVCDDYSTLIAAIVKAPGTWAVVKPIDKEGGEGVFIGPKSAIPAHVMEYPCIIQEFIDTSDGIPGIVDGIHDFRIVSICGEIILAFVRLPQAGSYLANVAQGGKTVEVNVTDIPPDALNIFRCVDSALQSFPARVYALDMGRHRDGTWKVIELNSKPALFGRERGTGFVRFHERLADLLLSA